MTRDSRLVDVRLRRRCGAMSSREEMRMSRRYGDITWDPSEAPTASPVAVAERPGRTSRRSVRHAQRLPSESLPSIRLHGVRLHAITEQQCIDHILSEIDAGHGGAVVTPNLDHIRRATR